MQLPALIPQKLVRYGTAEDERSLLKQLSEDPQELLLFFCHACEDETWCDTHPFFITNALVWLTEQSFREHLSLESIQKLAEAFHKHYPALGSMLPLNIRLCIDEEGQAIEANSMLVGLASGAIREAIRVYGTYGGQKQIPIAGVSFSMLQLIILCAHSGTVADLWKLSYAELISFLQEAVRLDVPQLSLLIQQVLKRYITADRAVDLLIMCHEASWTHLEQLCMDCINEQSWGVRLEIVEQLPGRQERVVERLFGLEFFDFGERALDLFSKLKMWITHLTCSGSLTEEAAFGQVMQECLHLVGLNISHTRFFSEYFRNIPSSLQELNLAKCSWLTPATFQKVIESCPNVTDLSLSSNLHLTTAAWGELKKLPLQSLDISRCHQIRDGDFSVIIRACPKLTHLLAEECSSLTDRAFLEIARSLPRLIFLDVSKCSISDGPLLDLSMHCAHLAYLFLARCSLITERSLFRIMELLRHLKVLDIRRCEVSSVGIEKLRSLRPKLKLVHDENLSS